MPSKKPKTKKPKPDPVYYGIAEWFGKDITTMTPEERQHFGQLAGRQKSLKKKDRKTAPPPPICPFLSNLIPGSPCNKKGGVCSIRKYAKGPDGSAITHRGEKIATVCPSRFLQSLPGGKSLFAWVAEKMLDVSNPIVVKETPFLRTVPNKKIPPALAADLEQSEEEEEAEEGKKAGRIDWILLDPATMEAADPKWCAVETQAVYFSGDQMWPDFEAYESQPGPLLFPAGRRRPDYRSSGPKRLSPQLDVKQPALGLWGKKIVVIIDGYFFENMNTLETADRHARNDRQRRENSEIVWFVVNYDDKLQLHPGEVVFTSRDSSIKALNATEPLSREVFTKNLKQTIESEGRSNKVFKV